LVCIAGGVGITAVIGYLREHTRANGPGAAKLYWGSRSKALVKSLQDEIVRYDGEAVVGRRMDVKSIIKTEVDQIPEGWKVAIVVSGPKSMADDARKVVCDIGRRRKGPIKLVDECFGW
jgi:NAD(P)H-flavin reductase